MSLDPQERLEALRREVAAEGPTVTTADDGPSSTGTTLVPPPRASAPQPVSRPPVAVPPGPAGGPGEGSPAGTSVTGPLSRLLSGISDLDVRELIADRSLSSWLGIGLLVLGGYLVLSWVVPGVAILGSTALVIVGVVLLYRHLGHGAASWTLYAGAALVGMGVARIAGALLPGVWHGATAIGVGAAFLVIGYLRHTQAGGYGWQGIVGGAALALGVAQLVLGWLPGSPGLSDLISPAVLLLLGALLVLGTRRLGGTPPPTRGT